MNTANSKTKHSNKFVYNFTDKLVRRTYKDRNSKDNQFIRQ